MYKQTFNPSRDDGLLAILYDRALGAFLSLYEWRTQGDGVVVVNLSHEPEAYPRNKASLPPDEPPRTMTFSFKQLGQGSRELNELYKAAMMTEEDDVPELFGGVVESAKGLTDRFKEGRFFAMAIIGPENRWINAYIMANWVSATHPVHAQLEGTPFGTDTMVFDWDNGRQPLLDAGVVSKEFYNQAMAHHEMRKAASGKEKSAFHPRWGGVYPPLAQHVTVVRNPNGK